MKNIEKLSSKIIIALFAEQSLFSASMIMAFTVGSIIAVELAGGNTRWSGVPAALVVTGAAVMAYPMGRLMDRRGRRIGLSIGNAIGIAGMLTAGFGIIQQSLAIFLTGVFGLGLTRGVIEQGRYAAAEASPIHKRARAISWVVLGGTVGSIVGPGFIKATTAMADTAGIPTMSGPWFAAACLFTVSLFVIIIFLRPDPQEIGKHLATLEPASDETKISIRRPYREIIRHPHVKLATGTLIFAQVAMVVVMVVTPVHMHGHNHQLGAISLVIMAHTLGMFGLSFVTGRLVEKLGCSRMILAGGMTLSLACFMAPFSNHAVWLAAALFLLGLGWNFCFVSGSTLLSDVVRAGERGRVQGLTDTMINISSGVGNLFSGFVFATFGFAVLSWLTILLGLILLGLVILLGGSGRKEVLVNFAE